MTLQIQTLLITYSSLAWSGSIGFAARASPTQRSARRSFGKQGTVAAKQQIGPPERHFHSHRRPRTGGHVLWVNPPSTSAIHYGFVQDFLSNMATYWLWG